MKTFGALFLALVLSCATAAAQPASVETSPNGVTIGQIVRELARHRSDGGMKPKVIGLDSADTSFIFAAAGSVAGAGGTYFRSDVTLVNHRSADQLVGLGWIAQGVDNSAAPLQYVTLPANTPVILEDFVAQTLHKSGLGAVLVTGVTASGAADSAAKLDGFSRIWTPQPGASGSVSQGFPSVSLHDSFGAVTAYALGSRHDNSFRTNVGIVNLDTAAHDWNVGVNGLSGNKTFSVSVPAVSMKQVALPVGNYGDLVLSFQSSSSGWWSAYGASVDNVSGDSWSAHASQP